MSMARKILYGAGAAVLLLIVVGVFLPSNAHLSREITVDAPAATVYALLSDTRRLQEWSPWAGRAADDDVGFDGPRRGRGASLHWRSPRQESGRQTIVEAIPYRGVVTEMELAAGGTFRSAFALDERPGGTRVAWSFHQDLGMNLCRRYLRTSLTGRIGRQYERGLQDLKSMAENLPRADFSGLKVEHIMVEPAPMAYVTTNSAPNAAAISEAMGAAFFQILRFMDRHGLREAGAPVAISRDFSGSQLVFDAAIPVAGLDGSMPGTGNGVSIRESYGGPAIRVAHVGSYAKLSQTHEKIAAWLAAYGIERNGDAWESYESDPARTPEPNLLTHVYYPVSEAPPAGRESSAEH